VNLVLKKSVSIWLVNMDRKYCRERRIFDKRERHNALNLIASNRLSNPRHIRKTYMASTIFGIVAGNNMIYESMTRLTLKI
jgi:hypothetical protein